jgi:uncharacterized protein YndB with AHSA1/START domain
MSQTNPIADRELVMVREFDAPPALVWQGWTDPQLMTQWFAPAPWSTPHAETDVRVGGGNTIVMRSPEGEDMPSQGVYLEVDPERRLVVTDAYSAGWIPSEKPFMTLIIDLEPLEGECTRATYTVRHWSAEDCEAHREMGFETGWGQCADQLNALLKGMKAS